MNPYGVPVILGSHWCFAAQILLSDISLQQPSTFLVRDRNCSEALVQLAFEFDETSLPNQKYLTVGNTICVMYARRALFDTTRVTRVTNGKNFQGHLLHPSFTFSLTVHTVFPCQLETLTQLGDRVVMERPVCRYCGKPATMLCTRCRVIYCSKVSPLSFIMCKTLIIRSVRRMIGNTEVISRNAWPLRSCGNGVHFIGISLMDLNLRWRCKS